MNSATLFNAIFDPCRDNMTAVVFAGRDITYAELREATTGTAGRLAGLGLDPGDRVTILLHDSPEFIASFLAIQSLGLIAVPINMGLRVKEQRLILADCTARAAIVEADLCNTLLTGASEALRCLKEIMIVSRDLQVEIAPVAGMTIREFVEMPLQSLGADFPIQREENAPAFILYTSGSTGKAKGAVHRQADLSFTNDTYCREVLRLQSGDRLFSSSRLPFAYGLGNSFTFPLLNGVTSVLCHEKPTAQVIGRIFGEQRPTIFFGVPVVYSLLLEHHHNVEPIDCSSLRLCLSAGEALPAQLGEEWQRTFGVEVLDGIGSTEMLHMWMSNHAGRVRYGSSGTLLEGYEARLLSPNGEPIPVGAEGNLWVKGASAALGYWQKPEQTVQTFVDGWVRTGDLYRCDADGYWFHMGRSDDCFKSSGQWVSPVEVEGALLRHPRVNRAAVVEDFDDEGLPCACAFIVSDEVESESAQIEAELRQLMKDTLPRFKRPRTYLFVAELPYTATGKIQRFKLREQLREEGVSRKGAKDQLRTK